MNKVQISKIPYFKLFALGLGYNLLMLFHAKLPTVATAVLGLAFVLVFLRIIKRHLSLSQSLLLLIIALIPTSFISVLGTSYASLPISWFSLTIVVLFALILRKRKIEPWFLVSFLVFILFALLSISWVDYPISAIKQIVNIGLFLFSFMIGAYFYKNESSPLFLAASKILYVQTAVIFAITVITQKAYIDKVGAIVGNYGEYALGRLSYAGLMGDFSFASLYIATGCIALLFAYADKTVKRFGMLVLGEAILVWSLIAVNARTGLFALAAAIAVGAFIAVIKGNIKAIILSIVMIALVLGSGLSVYSHRGDQSFTDGSDRNIEYSLGIQTFANHPLVGIGFGDDNYQKYIGKNPLPHNFYIQYLMQSGVIGLAIVLSSFFLFLRLPLTKDKGLLLVLVAVLAGSMLVPDILNSRYLFVIIVMSFISSGVYASSGLRRTS